MTLDRRQFVTALIAAGAAAAVPAASTDANLPSSSPATSLASPPNTKVDFRYAPRNQQSTICFPDDPQKTIVGQAGDLRYGYVKSLSAGMENFGTVIEFSLAGFQDDKILRQWVESPAVPIVHTLIDRPAATFELIAFATR
ncbi:MAG: twin-arginine translocation signal domain-containing protein, partial [Terriglobales bacterium]